MDIKDWGGEYSLFYIVFMDCSGILYQAHVIFIYLTNDKNICLGLPDGGRDAESWGTAPLLPHSHPLPLMLAASWAAQQLEWEQTSTFPYTDQHGGWAPKSPHPEGRTPEAHPRPPKGLDRQWSPDLGGRDLCWWSLASSTETRHWLYWDQT